MNKRVNLFIPYRRKRQIFTIAFAILVLALAVFCIVKTFLPTFTPLWVALIASAIIVIITPFLNMKKRVNFPGLRLSLKGLLSIFFGIVLGIYIIWYLSKVLAYQEFLSTAAIIITGIVGLIGALSLKRTIDTVRPFLTLTRTEFLVDESLQRGVMRLNIRNTGPTPAEKVWIRLSFSKLKNEGTNSELMSQTFKTPTIFPAEDRVITYSPRAELLKLIKDEEAKLTIDITYQSAQKKHHTTRSMNILTGQGVDEGKFPFNFIDTEDSWD